MTRPNVRDLLNNVVPGLKMRIMAASRHLTASRMGHATKVSGTSFIGSTKGMCAEAAAKNLCGIYRSEHFSHMPDEDEVLKLLRSYRLTRNSDDRFGTLESDREHLGTVIAALKAAFDEKSAEVDALYAEYKAGTKTYGPYNKATFDLGGLRIRLSDATDALAFLDQNTAAKSA